MSARRTDRLAGQIREELADVIGALKDPRIGFVTVTRVSLTEDLRMARVGVGVLGDPGQREKTLQGLRQAAGERNVSTFAPGFQIRSVSS